MKIKFVVPGEPKGKARPRVTKAGITYTPKETVSYENWVKTCFINQSGIADSGEVIAWMPLPEPWKEVKHAGNHQETWPTHSSLAKIIDLQNRPDRA
jgi:hypothetical protein